MTQEEPKTMNGLEALAYLNEKRGERFVKDNDGEVYKFSPEMGDIYRFAGSKDWRLIMHSMAEWIDSTFTACPDPSQPVESEYEKDKELLIEAMSSSRTFDYTCKVLVQFVEKHYQRKDPK